MNVLLAVTALFFVCQGEVVNDWHEPFSFQCPTRRAIRFIRGDYSEEQYDRRWDFICEKVPGFKPDEPSGYDINCDWTDDFVNDFRGMIGFTCQGNAYLNGFESYYNKPEGDRRWRYRCCTVRTGTTENCELEWANTWKENIDYKVPDGYVLKGVSSYYQRKSRYKQHKYWVVSRENMDMCNQQKISP